MIRQDYLIQTQDKTLEKAMPSSSSFTFPDIIYSLQYAYSCYNIFGIGDYKSDIALIHVGGLNIVHIKYM